MKILSCENVDPKTVMLKFIAFRVDIFKLGTRIIKIVHMKK